MISLHIFLVSILQGLTEFLPISSSAHLIILPTIMAVQDQGIIIDISVHLGSLLALLVFFRKDSFSITKGSYYLINFNFKKQEAQLVMQLTFATIPVLIMGFFFKIHDLTTLLRSVEIIGWMMICFGIFLYFADQFGDTTKNVDNWTYRNAIIMGVAQVIALIPGVSRSGITISAARILGYKRYEAIRLSMLMSIPTIVASGALLIPGLIRGSYPISFVELFASFILSFFSALLALFLLVRFLNTLSFTPYIIYRITLGFFLLWLVFS
ncbi:MAG: undecaprenyl-diphosphate phosphatase [Rhodobacteraceae bacterium]|nr:undecaprenyl-diphosphate phosphatase [Paracoccaceae bacterium]